MSLTTMIVSAIGCSSSLFRPSARSQAISLEPPPGVAAPAVALPAAAAPSIPGPSFADIDGRQLQGTLARSQEENQLLKDEVAVLREQLASTSAQLASARSTGMAGPAAGFDAARSGPAATGSQIDATAPGSATARRPPPQPAMGPAAMLAAMGQIAVPGIETRFDGHVVRIELPADRLFEGGGAALLPGGASLLTQVAGEIDRVYPGHFLGIEGHVDTEPLAQTSWGSPHQLTAARAAAVFEFFTTRTPLRQGQLFLVAHGANHPVVSNATAAGRTRNRRVELVVYPERFGAADVPPGEAP